MKKKIVILGSTSSIGKSLLNIIKKDKKSFNIELLTANTNYKDLINQAKQFNVRNLVITDFKSYENSKSFYKGRKIKIFKNFDNLKTILPKKVDYVMSSISGIGGLLPTFKIIKHTKLIAVANKEALICGWNLINKEFIKHKTQFIPIDSEHFSIWNLLQNLSSNDIEKIYITASGGPFLNLPKKKFANISVEKALNHPNWSMGKKITIDSATLMNKVFEVIEAKNIFNLSYKKIDILIHPNSYVHSIIKFKNGLTKILAHDPDMKIPIFNSLYNEKLNSIKTNSINLDILNNLNLKKVDLNKFPSVKILKKLPNFNSLFETALITINDFYVHKFLKNEIDFNELIKNINDKLKRREFNKLKKLRPKNVKQIHNLRDYVSSIINKYSV